MEDAKYEPWLFIIAKGETQEGFPLEGQANRDEIPQENQITKISRHIIYHPTLGGWIRGKEIYKTIPTCRRNTHKNIHCKQMHTAWHEVVHQPNQSTKPRINLSLIITQIRGLMVNYLNWIMDNSRSWEVLLWLVCIHLVGTFAGFWLWNIIGIYLLFICVQFYGLSIPALNMYLWRQCSSFCRFHCQDPLGRSGEDPGRMY